jgi:hypothetical protein
VLPPNTERVWNFLKDQPALEGFILVGGTAIALHLGHRLSEDLDLAFPSSRLPRKRLDSLRHIAAEAGFQFTADDDEAAVQQFLDSSLDLHDFQQDFLVNDAVKVSFFAPDPPMVKILAKPSVARPRIATLSELFKTKCLVSAIRSKTRDWLDLYFLMHNQKFSMGDFSQAFREAGIEGQFSIALTRLCSGRPQADDEGYKHLLPNAPSLEDMTAFFVAQRNQFEIEAAAEAVQRKAGKSP